MLGTNKWESKEWLCWRSKLIKDATHFSQHPFPNFLISPTLFTFNVWNPLGMIPYWWSFSFDLQFTTRYHPYIALFLSMGARIFTVIYNATMLMSCTKKNVTLDTGDSGSNLHSTVAKKSISNNERWEVVNTGEMNNIKTIIKVPHQPCQILHLSAVPH